MEWLHLGSLTVTTFLASLVEFVEALTIVLAVGVTRNWKSALAGSLAAILALAVLILIFGPSIQQIPLGWMQFGVGVVVLLFGLRWLKKATLRSAGLIPMHDEDQEYAQQRRQLREGQSGQVPASLDKMGTLTAFKGVFLEGLEVAFIVVTAGSVSGHFVPAMAGAAMALILVALVGLVVHRPLARVPENSLKKAVGIMLSSFGIFWVGEGLGMIWPLRDFSIVVLALAFTSLSFAASGILKRRAVASP